MMPVIDLLFGSNASIKKRNQIAAGKIKGKFIRISISHSVRLRCRHFQILLLIFRYCNDIFEIIFRKKHDLFDFSYDFRDSAHSAGHRTGLN